MSQMIRPTRSVAAYVQGKTWKVLRSGLRYMSDSSIRTKPSIDEPSNMIRPSSASSNCRSGTSTFLMTPEDVGELKAHELDLLALRSRENAGLRVGFRHGVIMPTFFRGSPSDST